MIMCQGQIPPTVVLPNFTPRFGGGFFNLATLLGVPTNLYALMG